MVWPNCSQIVSFVRGEDHGGGQGTAGTQGPQGSAERLDAADSPFPWEWTHTPTCLPTEEGLVPFALQSTHQDSGDTLLFVPPLSLTWTHTSMLLDLSFFNTNEQSDIN